MNRRLLASKDPRTGFSSTYSCGCSIEMMEKRLHFSGSPLSAVPALNSLPGAPATIYLDFHGEASQAWGISQAPATPAYDIDGDPSTFGTQELTNLQQIWSRVSEALSPFNVNVTTVDPGNWNLDGTATTVPWAPPNNQLRVVVGGTGAWLGATEGGAALQGSYAQQGMPNTVYVFSSNLGGDVPSIGNDTAHEIGHAMGLSHQSVYSGTTLINPYNPGNGSTAPFMGNPLATGIRATWWNGQSQAGSTIIQNDVAVIGGAINGFGMRPITAGQTAAAAKPLTVSGSVATAAGVIESTTQTDYYRFSVPIGGPTSIAVNVSGYGPMLHAAMELHDANNQLIQTAAAGSLSQSIVTTLAAGNYYLVVKSFGQYGDIGQYGVNVQLPTGSAKITGRSLFYNASVFDGGSVAASALDDQAIASDKQALLPGGTGQFSNISSYVQGINGLMIDITNLPALPTVADFSFKVGTSTDPSTWALAPVPTALRVRAGAGVGGASRVEFTWASGSITNEWLQVSVLANADTGLASPDVFYFGSLIGCADAATTTSTMVVTTADLLATRQDAHGFLDSVGPTNTHDFNRDGRVDLTDQAIVNVEAGAGASLVRLNAPVTGATASFSLQPIFVTDDPAPTAPSTPVASVPDPDPLPKLKDKPRKHYAGKH